MDDLTITRLCARAAGVNAKNGVSADGQAFLYLPNGDLYDPLHNRGQALELVERLRLDITPCHAGDWSVNSFSILGNLNGRDYDLLRAICVCAARVQQARETG